jgi:hypothetical protein
VFTTPVAALFIFPERAMSFPRKCSAASEYEGSLRRRDDDREP